MNGRYKGVKRRIQIRATGHVGPLKWLSPVYLSSLHLLRKQGEAVHFLGYTSHDAFYLAIDVLIVPSICRDSFPGVCIEWLAWGKPVIALRRGGIPEIVVDQETGFLFEPDKPGDLLAAM